MKCIKCFKRAVVMKNGNTYCKKCMPKDVDMMMEIPHEELKATLGSSI